MKTLTKCCVLSVLILMFMPVVFAAGAGPDADLTRNLRNLVEQRGAKIIMLAQTDDQKGRITGTVVSAETQKPVSDANVFVEDTDMTTMTDAHGAFTFELSPGTYRLTINHPEFTGRTVRNVKVSGGETISPKIEVTPSSFLEMEKIKVTATHLKGSIPAFMEEQRASPDVVDVLSADQMSKAGDTYLAEALKRVTGLTLVDDKFVYVRGLGERYSSVLLNGANLSSTDPTRRVVELDFIPGDVLEGIVVQKSYSPDLPASFGGGSILLRTRSYPDEFFCRLSGSTAYQSDTTFEDGKTYQGGDLDFLGFDDDTRELPMYVPSRSQFGLMPDWLREGVGKTFPRNYNVEKDEFWPDINVSAATGNQYRPGYGTNTFGYLAAVRYTREMDILDQDWRVFDAQGNITEDYALNWNDIDINLGAFLNLGASFGTNHNLSSTTMLMRDTKDAVRIKDGYYSDWDADVRETQLIWTERQMFNQQFKGEHDFPKMADMSIDWQYTFSKGDREEPDYRTYQYEYSVDGETLFLPPEYITDPNRTYSEMEDDTHDFSVDVRFPLDLLEKTTLKTGFKYVDKSRDFEMRRFNYLIDPFDIDPDILDVLDQSLEDILAPEFINPDDFYVNEFTRPSDKYTAEQTVFGYYGMADLRINPYWGLTGGLRYETSEQQVDSLDIHGMPNNADLDVDDVFPSVATTWFIGGKDDTRLRVAYSQTTNRPDFKELTTAEYTDPVTGLPVIGNPDLQPADIIAYDIRLEHFFTDHENIALSFFYKTFDSPIERIRDTSADGQNSFRNTDEAENFGIEFEVLKYLDFIDRFENFYIGGNFAYVDSEVTIGEEQKGELTNDKRPLQGQSDYIFNLNLGYENVQKGIIASLLYNYSGDRISELGTYTRDDVYREGTSRVDFVYRQDLGKNWKIKFEIENILDPEIEYTQGSETTQRFKEGRKFVLGFDYIFR